MSRFVKLGLFLIVPLLFVLGVAYGLAKIGVFKPQQIVGKSRIAASALKAIGLNTPSAAVTAAAPGLNAPETSGEMRAVQASRDELAQEKSQWEAQKLVQKQTEDRARIALEASKPDPKEMARLATVYDQMPADTVTKIFQKLPDDQVIALLRRMDEKQVAQVLGAVVPDRAARLTQILAHPPLPDRSTNVASAP